MSKVDLSYQASPSRFHDRKKGDYDGVNKDNWGTTFPHLFRVEQIDEGNKGGLKAAVSIFH